MLGSSLVKLDDVDEILAEKLLNEIYVLYYVQHYTVQLILQKKKGLQKKKRKQKCTSGHFFWRRNKEEMGITENGYCFIILLLFDGGKERKGNLKIKNNSLGGCLLVVCPSTLPLGVPLRAPKKIKTRGRSWSVHFYF
jgi:hypothetical protein